MIIKIVLLVLLIGPFQPSSSFIIVWSIVEHSRVYFLLRPYEREVKLWATNAMYWDVADYRSTILVYYRLLYDSILHNDLEGAAKYCGILLSLLLKCKGVDCSLVDEYIQYADVLDWSGVKIHDLTPEEIVDMWMLSEPGDPVEFMYLYASTAISLLDKMPVNSFVRVIHTPYLREMYVLSLVSILVASAYFTYRRARVEGGEVEVEAPP